MNAGAGVEAAVGRRHSDRPRSTSGRSRRYARSRHPSSRHLAGAVGAAQGDALRGLVRSPATRRWARSRCPTGSRDCPSPLAVRSAGTFALTTFALSLAARSAAQLAGAVAGAAESANPSEVTTKVRASAITLVPATSLLGLLCIHGLTTESKHLITSRRQLIGSPECCREPAKSTIGGAGQPRGQPISASARGVRIRACRPRPSSLSGSPRPCQLVDPARARIEIRRCRRCAR